MARLASFTAAVLAPLLVAAEQPTSSPWFGTWALRLKDPSERPETLIYSDAGDGRMRMVSVEEGRELITRFDGRPGVDAKRRAAPAGSLAIEATGATSYSWTFSRPGKPDVRGRNTLSADGRSFTEVSWRVTDPGRTVTLVYDRRR